MSTAMQIEKEYRDYLSALKERCMTAAAVEKDAFAYNDAAEKTLVYLRQVALRSGRNHNLIRATGFDPDMFADDITMHILRKLDAILACSPEHRMAFLVSVVNNEVVSICRKWQRMYPTVKHAPEDAQPGEWQETEGNRMICHLDDAAWGVIADDGDIEEDLIRRETEAENRIRIRKTLAYSNACSRFEMLCLLATKVVAGADGRCMKTRALAEAIDRLGLPAVSERCFEKAALVLGVSCEVYFSTFSNDALPAYSSLEQLCDKISKASHHCAVKLCRKMGAVRAAGRRTPA